MGCEQVDLEMSPSRVDNHHLAFILFIFFFRFCRFSFRLSFFVFRLQTMYQIECNLTVLSHM